LPAIRREERGEVLPLSFAQQRLWFLAQMEGGSKAYHMPFGLRLQGRLDVAALKQGLDRIVARHEALRTTFVMVKEEPQQRITPVEESGFLLLEHDLRGSQEASGELELLVLEEAETGFDLEAGPLIRGRLVRLEEEEYALLITIHHIVFDGWSMGVFFRELKTLYQAFAEGEPDPLPELAVQYADYAVWQRKWMEGEILEQQAEYWRKNLAGAPELLELPADRVRPMRQDYAGAAVEFGLEEKLVGELKRLSARQGTTLYMTLLAGWAMLLGRLSGQQDMMIGTPVANRGRVELESLMGFFVNTLVMRVDLSGNPTVGEVLGRVKQQAIAAQQHQEIPFEQVVELVQPERSLGHSPLFQVMFALQDAPGGRPELAGVKMQALGASPHVVSRCDLTLSLQSAGEGIEGGVEYATALFEQETVERYVEYYRRVLEGMAWGEQARVERLPLMGEEERRQVVYEWNRTKSEIPEGCVHELFEEQAEKRPEAVAVVCGEQTLSYAELNARANQLAHYLRELGVGPEGRVAICVERGLEMIVGVLGIMKAGGAYVPLDPGYPRERLRYMLEDSRPVALVTQSHLQARFTAARPSLPVVELSSSNCPWREHSSSNPKRNIRDLTASHLATLAYTSGFGGKLKGVEIEHRSIVNFIGWAREAFAGDLLARTIISPALTFGPAGYEFLLLIAGTGVTLSRPEELLQRDFEATMITTVPSSMTELLDAKVLPTSLRAVSVTGELLKKKLSARIFAETEVEELWNFYGTTETATYAASAFLKRGETMPGNAGRPIANSRVYVLDEQREPVPIGVIGDLYVAGMGVARGYLNLPGETAERFLADPFSPDAAARMYRTVDRGRWRKDGTVEFLGRSESQAEVRGHRIELAAIEERLEEYEEIGQAVVVELTEADGKKYLVAYYTLAESARPAPGGEVTAEKLRDYLARNLPAYMVPPAYVRLEKLPMTSRGKLDRQALPAPQENLDEKREYQPPEGEMETTLAGIWAEVLQVERVSRQDNFFARGGRSLLAVQVIARLRQSLGVEVGVDALFARPVLASFAEWIIDQQLAAFDSDDLANALKQIGQSQPSR
jgi:amino acid adenylation domain-containing protein